MTKEKQIETESQRKDREELDNYRVIAAHLVPTLDDLPKLDRYEIYGGCFPLKDVVGGGDHIGFFDFGRMFDFDVLIKNAKKNRNISRRKRKNSSQFNSLINKLEETSKKAGILISDAAGHAMTDSSVSNSAYLMFNTALLYEIERNGEVTLEVIENINNVLAHRFTSRLKQGSHKFLTMLYGELSPQNNSFRYVSAGHPSPILYSGNLERIISLEENQRESGFAMGVVENKSHINWKSTPNVQVVDDDYKVNEISLKEPGDFILLHSDGLAEHTIADYKVKRRGSYRNHRLPKLLDDLKVESARNVVSEVYKNMKESAEIEDDVTLCVVKRVE